MSIYQCSACYFLYNEEDGLPEEGISPGTRWEDIPENFVCPECGTPKHNWTEYHPD